VKDSTTKIGQAGNGLAFFVFGLWPPESFPAFAGPSPPRRRFAEALLRHGEIPPAAVAADARRTIPSPTSKPTASRMFPSNVETSDANRPAQLSPARRIRGQSRTWSNPWKVFPAATPSAHRLPSIDPIRIEALRPFLHHRDGALLSRMSTTTRLPGRRTRQSLPSFRSRASNRPTANCFVHGKCSSSFALKGLAHKKSGCCRIQTNPNS
jgi:hypothetical protein